MAAPKPVQLAIVLSPVCTVIIPGEDTQKMGNLSIEALWRKKATIASSVVFKANIEVTSNTISWP